jgi:hypothetical protein
MSSCKSYDDDINGLETDVAGLKTELTSLDSDISSAQTAATEALAKAQEALTAAQAAGKASDVAALQAQVAAIQTQLTALSGLKAEVTALMTELETANAKQLADIKAEVQTLSDQLKAMLGGMVTDVELLTKSPELKFSTIKEKANVFEEGIANAITFVKDKQIQTTQTFVIRVSPTNAEITPEMISLQNSEGETYDNIEVVSVKQYDKLLTRSTNGSGLWEVTVQLKEYVAADFDAATKAGGAPILFAVAVDNTKTAENPMVRKVITDYDVTLSATSAAAMNSALYYFVDKTKVTDLQSRGVNEYKWKSTPAVEAITTGDNINVATDNEGRSSLPLYPAVQGQPIKISLSKSDYSGTPDNIRALYVTLDTKGVDQEDPSELNAWKSYTYTGLNTVVEGTETNITIGGATAINDVIGFRVYAVNIDGTLVDPDGKAFYVSVGSPAGTWPTVATVATPTSETMTPSADVAVTLSKLTGATKYTWTTEEAKFNVQFLSAEGNVLFTTTAGTDQSFSDPDFSLVKKIRVITTESSWLNYKDNQVYNGTLTIKNATGHVLTTMNVTFKKVLPTAAPAGFQALAGQLVNGVYNSIMTPSNASGVAATEIGATHGTTVKMDQIFAFGTSNKDNYTFSFANSAKDADGKSIAKVVTGGTNALTVAKEFIDNTTEHVTTVKYNYGQISTETENHADYVVPVYEFNTVYSNIYKTYTWNWATREQLGGTFLEKNSDGTWKNELPATSVKQGATDYTISAAHIYGVSTIPTYNVFLSNAQKLVIGADAAKLISDATNNEDYFTVNYNSNTKVFSFTPKSASALTVNVPSKLVITAKDFYNNDVVIKIPVTVTP